METETINRILQLNIVPDRTGLSRSTLYREIQAGTFPKQISISARCCGWRAFATNAVVAPSWIETIEVMHRTGLS
jgi:prophage regulatory protein